MGLSHPSLDKLFQPLTDQWAYLEAGWLFDRPWVDDFVPDIANNNHDLYLRNGDGDEYGSSSLGSVIDLDDVDDQLRHLDDGTRLGLYEWTLAARVFLPSSYTGRDTASSGTGGVVGYPIIAKGRGEDDGNTKDCNYFFAFNTSLQLVADYEDTATGANHPVTGSTTLSEDTWYDVACTYDGSNLKVWYKKVESVYWIEDGSTATTADPRQDSIQKFAIAGAVDSTGAGAGNLGGYLKWAFVFNSAINLQTINLLDAYGPTIQTVLPLAGNVGSLTAGATSASIFGAVATVSASVTEGAEAGDTPGGAAAAQAALLADATAADIQAALAIAQAAITEGVSSGEVWAADAVALASTLEAALAGATFTGAILGAATGAITEGSTSQVQFLGAVQAVASITAGALADDVLTATILRVAALTAGATAADLHSGAATAAAPLTAGALSGDSLAGSATTAASFTSGALAGASFDIAGEIGNLVADIIIQAAVGGAILIGKATDGDVTIN